MDEQLANEDGPFICETINWTNCAGTDIVEYQVRCGVAPEGFSRFRTPVTLNLDGKPAWQQMTAIPAETIEEAFILAPEVITGAGPEMLEAFKAAIRKKQQPELRAYSAAEARQMGHNGNHQQRRADAAQHNRMRGNF